MRLLRPVEAGTSLMSLGRVTDPPLEVSVVVAMRVTTKFEPILVPLIKNGGKLFDKAVLTNKVIWCLDTELTLVTVKVKTLVVKVIGLVRKPLFETVIGLLLPPKTSGPLAIVPDLTNKARLVRPTTLR